MLGRHHITLSVGTVAVVVLPLFMLYPIPVLIILTGTAIGSLIPDADSPDAAIFHSEVKGLTGGYSNLINVVAILNPVFGFGTKYLIYKPAVRFYDSVVFDEYGIKEDHRGFLHSFLGVGTATMLTGVYTLSVLVFLDLLWFTGLGLFLFGYLVGALLHLLEDSCTKSGIQWNYPFQSWKLRGEISTTARPEDMAYQRGLLTVLGVGSLGMFFAPTVTFDIPIIAFVLLGVGGVSLCWGIFTIRFAKCSVHPT
jgi:membrane-bound metal-dependent hydrolase YbcI (DUF457 family)